MENNQQPRQKDQGSEKSEDLINRPVYTHPHSKFVHLDGADETFSQPDYSTFKGLIDARPGPNASIKLTQKPQEYKAEVVKNGEEYGPSLVGKEAFPLVSINRRVGGKRTRKRRQNRKKKSKTKTKRRRRVSKRFRKK